TTGDRGHAFAGLEAGHLQPPSCELHRRLPGARPHLEHAITVPQPREPDHVVYERRRIAGPRPVVGLGDLAEHESLLTRRFGQAVSSDPPDPSTGSRAA